MYESGGNALWHHRKKEPCLKGYFSLIELLVVIAMIAILLHSKSGFFMANYGNSVF